MDLLSALVYSAIAVALIFNVVNWVRAYRKRK
jgi:hypothetical protein